MRDTLYIKFNSCISFAVLTTFIFLIALLFFFHILNSQTRNDSMERKRERDREKIKRERERAIIIV